MAEPEDSMQMLRRFLANRDVACPQCQYNLRDLQTGVCPECGRPIALGISGAEKPQSLVIAGLIGLTMGAGMNAMLLVYVVIQLVILGPIGQRWGRFILINVAGVVALGGLMVAWLRQWQRIERCPLLRQWLLVIACCLLSVIDVVIFALTIR